MTFAQSLTIELLLLFLYQNIG